MNAIDGVDIARVALALVCVSTALRRIRRGGSVTHLDVVVFISTALALVFGSSAPIVIVVAAIVAFVAFVVPMSHRTETPAPPDEAAVSPNGNAPLRPLEAESRILVIAPSESGVDVVAPLSDRYDVTIQSTLRGGAFDRLDFDLVVLAGAFERGGRDALDELAAIPALQDVPIVLVQPERMDAIEAGALLEHGAADLLAGQFTARELLVRVDNLVHMKRTRDALTIALGASRDELHAVVDQVATKHRELESALHETRLARSMAERAAGMKSNLLRMMAHELRTPVAAVQLQVRLLERETNGDGALSPAQQEIVTRIRRNLSRLLELIETALEYARIESDRYELFPTSFPLQDILQTVVNDQLPLAEQKSLYLRVEASPMPRIVSDANLVRLVAANLVGNAVKFTQSGGVVIRAWRDEDHHVFTVEDTGPGIPVEERDEVFEPFTRGDDVRYRTGTGSGLGLALVKEMVSALGGAIELRSSEAGGTTFEVTLPSVSRRRTAAEEALAPSAPPG